MTQAGQKIDTDFTFNIVQNGEEKHVSFQNLLNRPTVVSDYMKNNTPGCDRQNKSLANEAGWFDERGYNLIAVSKDSCNSHKKYAQKKGINYILASDPDYEFAKATDSIIEKNIFGKKYEGPSRSAYLIDTDGTVLAVIPKIDTKNHAEELKKVIKNL